jgi:tRNA G18 (ribose-2'-O)-methylase SpoU
MAHFPMNLDSSALHEGVFGQFQAAGTGTMLPMRTRFILIETSHPGNVGAAARALKVMGFDEMVLVAPRYANVLRKEETIQRASGAIDVLDKTRIVDTLEEALGWHLTFVRHGHDTSRLWSADAIAQGAF